MKRAGAACLSGWNTAPTAAAAATNSWYRYDLTKAATNAMNELIPGKIHPWNNAEQSEAA